MAAQKHSDADRIGGPGAAHENRKHPEKSRPHGELPHEDAGSGNAATRQQGMPSGNSPLRDEGRSFSNAGDTGKGDDPIKPKNRRQVR